MTSERIVTLASVDEQVGEHPGLVGGERLPVAAEQQAADVHLRQRLQTGALGELLVLVRAGRDHDLLVWDLADVQQVLDRVAQRADLVGVDGDSPHDQSTSRSSSMPLMEAACTSWAPPSGMTPMKACGSFIEPARSPSAWCSGESRLTMVSSNGISFSSRSSRSWALNLQPSFV